MTERRPGRRAVGAAMLAAAGGVLAGRIAAARPAPELPHAVSGERRELDGRAGRLSYYVAGEGAPLLLIHSINAAGSAYEVRPIFEAMRDRRRVYALDLPGFGFSDRSRRPYRVELYVAAIEEMVELIGRESGGAPVDALAISLACEFLARVAVQRPARFRRLALVTPTGFSRGSDRLDGPEGATREVPGLHGFFTVPIWSQAIYELLVSRASIRFFLKKTFGSPTIDEGLLDYDYATAHQPGARHAPYAFVSGRLFSKDIRTVYKRLAVPVWMPHATRGDFADFSESGWTRQRSNWAVQPMPTGALPHFEQPAEFMAGFERFLAAEPRAGSSDADSRESVVPPVEPHRAVPLPAGSGSG